MRFSVGALLLLTLLCASQARASVLALENRTDQEIINIFIRSGAKEFFLRLDLLPGASDSVENPDCAASLRVDTGLELWRFREIDLALASRLVFCGEHPGCLIISSNGSESGHVQASVERLVPGHGDRPVCNLDQFRPAMTMAEVCEILPGEMIRDDNGALLAGLGFAGLIWAARLVPEANAPVSEKSLLDHLVLRRPLSLADLEKLLEALRKQGYVPWQADFPGLEVNLASEPAKRSDAEALGLARSFLKQRSQEGHGSHAKGDRCSEASIIMAPQARLAELENADEPASDVQIFTIYLQPCTNTLLLDLAAYRKGN